MMDFVKKHRRSIRLRDYDYSQMGLYFITLCCHHRAPLFGRVEAGDMILNAVGQIAHEQWLETAKMRSAICLHEFVIMPNHMHGIVEIVSMDGDKPATLGDVVRGYKSAVTKMARLLFDEQGLVVWQRNYYEHIIRNEQAHEKITQYIANNPSQWANDTYFA